MKKLIVFAILIGYSVASFGIGFNYFYCCGKLKSVTVRVNVEDKDGGNKTSKGCCNHKKVILKLKLAQKGTNSVSYQFHPPLSVATIPGDSYISSTSLAELKTSSLYLHSPPKRMTSFNVLYCVFRI